MKEMKKYLLITAALYAAINGNVHANEHSVEDIVKAAYQACYYPGDDAQRKARMMIVDAQGSKQLRQFNIFKKDKVDGGDQDFLVVFEKPSDVKNTVFLVNKHVESEDDRWIYLPGLDLDKRISASDKRTSFVGSNYFYEDISGRNIKLDNFELVAEDDASYQIQATPKDPTQVEFDLYRMNIDKKTMLPMSIEYFKNDKPYRKAEILEVKEVDGYPTVFKSKISNFETGGYTMVQFKAPNYNVGLEADLFTERSLRNPPKDLYK
ncbi:MAG: outer membrane lipoprotein-sorting protein [Gammaproteobacteria bacterium]|nr:outer membrane lipoprotein-sorting protein [Gammaproteobacteria bacterium]